MMPQQVRRTVGDTLTIVQRYRVAPNMVVQPRSPTDSSLVTLLSPPSMTREGESVRIDFHVALWQAGNNELTLPGPVVVSPEGIVDTLPEMRVLLQVTSLLPSGKPVATVAPKSARSVLPRGDQSALPFLVLFGLLLPLLALVWWWRRRRGPDRVLPRAPMAAPVDRERVARWLKAGEAQLSLTHVEALLRDQPGLDEWRARAAAARFARGADAELALLVREGWDHLA